ncbi:alpha/beta fold hydrolase [Nocardia sp. NPDC058176]|uniref:alpha/beta fold hydrolase n=1 Tax=Nocardia sp. NPDC058176 TaxID=3346368 RepID=UPI0036DF51C0
MTGAHAVLIHGAWAGPWVWDRIAPSLEHAGLQPVPVTLPGVGPTAAGPPVGLGEVAAAVIAQIATLRGPLVLVGHSGGGVVATEVAERLAERVAGVVFVAGMMLPSGRSFPDLCRDVGLGPTVGIGAHLEISDDGRISRVPPAAAATIFFHGAAPADAITAANRVAAQQESARFLVPSWTAHRFGALPRLYIEATEDRSVPLAVQRRMQELTPGAQVHTLDSDHAPQLCLPDATAAAILSFSSTVLGVGVAS